MKRYLKPFTVALEMRAVVRKVIYDRDGYDYLDGGHPLIEELLELCKKIADEAHNRGDK